MDNKSDTSSTTLTTEKITRTENKSETGWLRTIKKEKRVDTQKPKQEEIIVK